jgi:hypothetical protein
VSPDNEGSNVQSLAMLWRLFTTRLDDGTSGDLIAHTNMNATFESHERSSDQFKVTWKISVMRARTSRRAWVHHPRSLAGAKRRQHTAPRG